MAEWRKAGETVNDGERRVLQRLRDGLPGPWVVLSNLYLRMSSAMVLEIDAVVVGRDGIWALETKDWSGKIAGDTLHWQLDDGSLRDSPTSSIERKAKALHSFLVDANPVYRNVSKVGLVVIANNAARLKLSPDERKVVFLLDEIVPALRSGEHVFGRLNVKLDRDNIRQIADELFRAKVACAPRRAGNYLVDEPVGTSPTYAEFRGRHAFLPSRPVLLKRFTLADELAPKAERKDQVRLFLRDMEALALLEAGRHPALPVVYDFFPDEDSDAVFWMAEEWRDGQPLSSALAAEQSPYPRWREVVGQLCDALAFCHRRGVVHRNLSTDNVLIEEDGRVALVNFDYARVAGRPTVSPRKRAQATAYLAPELLGDPAGADHRADLYALGVLWGELLIGSPVKECSGALQRRGLGEAELSCLRRLLSPSPQERPDSAEEVARACGGGMPAVERRGGRRAGAARGGSGRPSTTE